MSEIKSDSSSNKGIKSVLFQVFHNISSFFPKPIQAPLSFIQWLIQSQNPNNTNNNDSAKNHDLESNNLQQAAILNNIICSGWIPDNLLRLGVKYMLKDRLNEGKSMDIEKLSAYKLKFVHELKSLPIALAQKKANDQHYEVPASFYLNCLGSHLKYSCALFPTNNTTLDEAELAMLTLYTDRAELIDGQRVLDLGCGWGSFSLFAAPRYPNSQFIAVSNSNSQREFIMNQAKIRGINNLTVITKDATQLTIEDLLPHCKSIRSNTIDLDLNEADVIVKTNKKNKNKQSNDNINDNGDNNISSENRSELLFDRVISIEMFEHMKNYELLIQKVATFLKPSIGKLFVHIFVSREYPYHFQDDNWMAAYFFSGGTMPDYNLLLNFQKDLYLTRQWAVNGKHYGQTSRCWLDNMDKNKTQIIKDFNKVFGEIKAKEMWYMWRVFYIAVEELFNFNNGEEWFVGHYLFQNK